MNLADKPQSKFFDKVGNNMPAVKKQERRVAKVIGGRRQPCSGSLPYAKGDARSEDVIVSCKRTKNKSISITESMLLEVVRLSIGRGLKPVMQIELGGIDPRLGKNWVLLRLEDFGSLLRSARGED